MIFTTLICLTLVAVTIAGIKTNWRGETFGVLAVCMAFSAFVLLFSCKLTFDRTDVPHTDISTVNYAVADGSNVNIDRYSFKFFYKENGTLKEYSEYTNKVIIQSADGKTVQVVKTRYDLGFVVFPWGMDRVDTTAVVK